MNSKKLVLVTILVVLLICLPVQAAEYKPLELDIPADSYNEPGTTTYTICSGDTLFSIGRHFNSDAYLIAALNDIKDPDYIKPGQTILVPNIFEVTHRVTVGETIRQIAAIYGILPQQILFANDIWYPDQLKAGTVLAIPGVKASVTITSNNSTKISSRNMQYFMKTPATGVLTSLFGPRHDEFHTGVDLSNSIGTPIRAAQGGKVTYVGWKGNYGKTVIIDHLNGYKTLYGHSNKILVAEGQWVQAGEKIALMGNTGRSTGPHLHFEVYEHGKVVDPLKYIYIVKSDY
ncbi:MAG: peptidoglycan DD-metalloendopeptidase family protein [Peptococcaceae bacterium]